MEEHRRWALYVSQECPLCCDAEIAVRSAKLDYSRHRVTPSGHPRTVLVEPGPVEINRSELRGLPALFDRATSYLYVGLEAIDSACLCTSTARRLAAAVMVLLVVALPAFAQTPTPVPTVQFFPFVVGQTRCGKARFSARDGVQIRGCEPLNRLVLGTTPGPPPTPTPFVPRCPPFCPIGQRCLQADCDTFGECFCQPLPVVATPTPIAVPRCPSTCPDGTRCDPVACGAFCAPSCRCEPRSTPGPTRSPTVTPRATGTPGATPTVTLPIAGVWFPIGATGFPEVYAAWGQNRPTQLADVEWLNGFPPTPDADVLAWVAAAKAAGRRPRMVFAEPSTFSWGTGVDAWAGGFTIVGKLKPAASLPETLGAPELARLRLLVDAGVTDLMAVPYAFGWACRETNTALLANAKRNNPQFWTMLPPPGSPDAYAPGMFLDMPTPTVLARDAYYAAMWARSARAQHPEITRVVFQLSNCGGSYGWQGKGYEIAGLLTAAARNAGYAPELQIEGCSNAATGGPAFQAPFAECGMWKAALATGAKLSVWSDKLYRNGAAEGFARCP